MYVMIIHGSRQQFLCFYLHDMTDCNLTVWLKSDAKVLTTCAAAWE